MQPRRIAPALLAAVVATLVLAACGGSLSASPEEDGGAIVVTYSVLGSLVEELVGDTAEVQVLMPNGVDPHDWQPSAKNVEAINEADIVVANGLDLEEMLEGPLDQAASAGVPVLFATDYVEVRTVGESEVREDEEHAGEASGEHAGEHEDEHGAGAEDPHIWTDPLAMEAVVAALAARLEQDLGLDVSARASELEAELEALNTELEQMLAGIPAGERRLVTGHESMGYFADRYDFELVGALIPSISSQAEVSAGGLAQLKRQIEEAGVPAIFTEIGTPSQVAEAIGEETGVDVVELPSHSLPDDGSYFTFMRDIATKISDALGP